MKTLQVSKSIQWQTERANRLQRACQTIKAAIQRGEKLSRAVRRAARSRNGRKYKSDPSRRLALTASTLLRLWYVWKRGGEIPAAFKLKFSSRPLALTAPVAIRFADFCAAGRHQSMRAAWQKFSARAGAFGLGRRKKNRPQISYDMLCYNFRAANFYRLQKALKGLHAAQINLAKERLDIIAGIRARLPDCLPRRRVKREITFEI